MTAFLKIDRCALCRQERPWEWIPPLMLAGKQLAGTGVWRSVLIDEICEPCWESRERDRQGQSKLAFMRDQFIRLVGGLKPYREFTFERYKRDGGNSAAFIAAGRFDPTRENLYLWGPCGVGKTHLAIAILRRLFASGASILVATPAQLVRKLRMKPPEEEQQVLDSLVRVTALAIDDLGVGNDSSYGRQILQEILDGREYAGRGGLVVTSSFSLPALARKFGDAAVCSRLAGMCRVVEIRGHDRRQRKGSQS